MSDQNVGIDDDKTQLVAGIKTGAESSVIKAPKVGVKKATKKAPKVVQINDSVLTQLKGKIEEEQVAGGEGYHIVQRAGIRRRILISTYQIRELLIDLEGRQNKKFRKHYDKHAETAQYISTLPYTLDGGKSNYRVIWKELKELESALVESATLVDVKIKKFGTKSKSIQARISVIVNTVSDTVVTEEEFDIAM